ncbi:MAG TPA: metal ABC transporter substrate-binding protein [Thermoplasmata archaeon]|nr:metal ABC transporter substrate-binding protein [Thermoplasmata archaeon]
MGVTRPNLIGAGRAAVCFASALVLMSLAFVGVASGEDDKLMVVCTNSALADFATNVFGEELGAVVEIEYIMPAGVCPSHFDTSPSDVVTIASADVVISLGWEPWLSDLLESSGNEDAFGIACLGLGEWNIPSGAELHINRIAEGLSEFRPEWNSTFTANALNYSTEIANAYEEARQMIAAEGLNGTKVVTIDWYALFLEGLGFEVAKLYGAPEGLSTADILEISAACDDPEVAMVVDNLQSTVDFGMQLAADYGKIHVVLSNFPGAIPGKYTYLDNFEYNVDELVNGAIAYETTQSELSDLESEISSLEFQRIALASAAMVLGFLLLLSLLVARRKKE